VTRRIRTTKQATRARVLALDRANRVEFLTESWAQSPAVASLLCDASPAWKRAQVFIDKRRKATQ
jgi:hypothetical protein